MGLSAEEWKFLAVVFASVTSAIVSVIVFYKTRTGNIEIEKLKSTLLEQGKNRDAKRDYEYEALKHLYSEYEPLRFLLVESCEAARREVGKIAKLYKLRKEGEAEEIGMMPIGNYFQASRLYNFLLPSVYFMLIRRKLTHVDLESSPVIHLQYSLSKQAFLMFSRDSSVARALDLDYTPYVEGWREKRIENPKKYRRQGLPHGRVENALEALINANKDFAVKTFGEFENELAKLEEKSYNSPLGAPLDLFEDFSPDSRPVLWSILLCQALIYGLIIEASRQGVYEISKLPELLDELSQEYSKYGIEDALKASVLSYMNKKVVSQLSQQVASPDNKIKPTSFGGD